MKKPKPDNNGEDHEAEIEPEDFVKAFYILLRSMGGAYSFPAALFEEINDDEKLLEVVYSEADERIYVKTVKKRKRCVLRPKRKLILPGD